MHMHFDVEFNAGMLATITVGAPGIHGAGVIGVHGPGVSTPNAAAVNAAVAGFDSDMQTPKGMMFTNGTWSMMLAIGLFSAITRFVGKHGDRRRGGAHRTHEVVAHHHRLRHVRTVAHPPGTAP